MSALTDFWLESYRKKRGARYKGFSQKDGAILARLCKDYGEKELRWIICRYLEIEDDPLVRNRGWDTGGLSMRARSLDLLHAKKYGEAEVEKARDFRAATETIARDPKVLSLLDRIGSK